MRFKGKTAQLGGLTEKTKALQGDNFLAYQDQAKLVPVRSQYDHRANTDEQK